MTEEIKVLMKPEAIDTTAGKKIEDIVCDKCKQRIDQTMRGISKLSLLNPLRVAKKMERLLCNGCRKACLKKLKND